MVVFSGIAERKVSRENLRVDRLTSDTHCYYPISSPRHNFLVTATAHPGRQGLYGSGRVGKDSRGLRVEG
jgi:hypothetical protein